MDVIIPKEKWSLATFLAGPYFTMPRVSSIVMNWFGGTLENFCFVPLGQVTSIEVTTGSWLRPKTSARSLSDA
jgi:hypothetical protein